MSNPVPGPSSPVSSPESGPLVSCPSSVAPFSDSSPLVSRPSSLVPSSDPSPLVSRPSSLVSSPDPSPLVSRPSSLVPSPDPSPLVSRPSSLVPSPKVVVLGLDGVPYTLLKRFASEGVMPEVARLIEKGTLCSLTASIPEVSSTSWSTFMTGVNPGRHGIFGFMEIQKDSYAWRFPNFNDLKSKTIWDLAGESGKKSIVLNVPSTYPARPLNGMLVSGFVALDLQKACYPDALFQYLKGIEYRLDVDARKAVDRVDEFAGDIMKAFQKRVEAINHLFDAEEWDLFIATITETDRLHHYLWAALEDPLHPYHGFFLDFYRSLDTFIGEFSRKAGNEIPFLMLSDHGFTSIRKEVYLNVFLQERGYLKFIKPDPQSFADMDGSSTAFALDPSRIYLHAEGRFSRGVVKDADIQKIRESLKTDLLSLRVDGEKVINNVFFREELYHGECLPEAPDIVLLPYEGFDLKGNITKKTLTDRGPLTGGHTRDNAMLYINRALHCENPNIVDVGATVLHLLGVTPKERLDGTSLIYR